ncbi:uncharacterized protein [Rutidosis leptorrhynchoides]|uniref:uncharacterized protein n=1 Tax=Rutidosis leptorrhynchoides TaxID=125765 RepID=UPI003A98EBB6
MKGFKDGCRPYIGPNGCHIHGLYGGILLVTVGIDANNDLFPLVVAVVEVECTDSWTWFLKNLEACIGQNKSRGNWTFMSDQQKGLGLALDKVFPYAFHRFCERHMYANFRSDYHGMLLRLDFWIAARAFNLHDWNTAMEEMSKHKDEAVRIMARKDKETWARHSFNPFAKCENITNNDVESFNSWVRDLRDLHLDPSLEIMHPPLMKRLSGRPRRN